MTVSKNAGEEATRAIETPEEQRARYGKMTKAQLIEHLVAVVNDSSDYRFQAKEKLYQTERLGRREADSLREVIRNRDRTIEAQEQRLSERVFDLEVEEKIHAETRQEFKAFKDGVAFVVERIQK